jgi:hypothetical protein
MVWRRSEALEEVEGTIGGKHEALEMAGSSSCVEAVWSCANLCEDAKVECGLVCSGCRLFAVLSSRCLMPSSWSSRLPTMLHAIFV